MSSRKIPIGLGLIATLFTALTIFPPERIKGRLDLGGFTDWEIKRIYADPKQEVSLGRSEGGKITITDYNRNFKVDEGDEVIGNDGNLDIREALGRVNRERYGLPEFIYKMF